MTISGDAGVVWFDEAEAAQADELGFDLYVEGRIAVVQPQGVARYERMFVRLTSSRGLSFLRRPAPLDSASLAAAKASPIYTRGLALRQAGEFEFASQEPPPSVAEDEEQKHVTIEADRVFTDESKKMVVATGNVRIARGDLSLEADSVVLWYRGKVGAVDSSGRPMVEQFYAEGSVTFRRADDLVWASRIFEHIPEKRGLYRHAKIKRTNLLSGTRDAPAPPVQLAADEIRHVGEGRYEAENASVSTCPFERPHWRFSGQHVRLVKREDATSEGVKKRNILTSIHNKFSVFDVPVLYLPFITWDVSARTRYIEAITFGSSDEFGGYVTSLWNLNDFGLLNSGWCDLFLRLDYMNKRGPAVGVAADYERSNSFGFVDSYYIRDKEDEDRPGVRVPKSDRGRVLWRHRQFLEDGWRSDIEVYHISDRQFLREFFEEESQEGKEEETVLHLRKIEDNRSLSYVQKHRINSFQTKVEQFPTIEYRMIGEPLLGDRLNALSRVQFANLRKKIENGLGIDDPPTTRRADWLNEVQWPFRLWGAKVSPFVSLELTAADNGLRGNRFGQVAELRPGDTDSVNQRRQAQLRIRGVDDRSSQFRAVNNVGFSASTHLSRVYNLHSKRFQINRIRHVMTPEVRWEYTPFSTGNAEEFIQFDEIDTVDQIDHVTLGLRNRFQTKRGRPENRYVVDYVTVDLEADVFPGHAGMNRNLNDNLRWDVIWQTTERIVIASQDNQYDFGLGHFSRGNLGVSYSPTPRIRTSLGYTYIHANSSAVTFVLECPLSDRWELLFYEQYDFNALRANGRRKSKNLETQVTFRRDMHEWFVDLIFSRDEGEGDVSAKMAVIPKGIRQRKRRY